MPFKSKQQKISASQRRYSFTQEAVRLPHAKYGRNDLNPNVLIGQSLIKNTHYVRKELITIIVISLLIILGQIGLRLTLF